MLESDDYSTDWDNEIHNHLVMISFFSHERLIHLIVTALFALISIIVFLYLLTNFSISIGILMLLLLLLLIPYIKHYYLLENSVQKMYSQYDAMLNKKKTSFMLENKEQSKYYQMKKGRSLTYYGLALFLITRKGVIFLCCLLAALRWLYYCRYYYCHRR